MKRATASRIIGDSCSNSAVWLAPPKSAAHHFAKHIPSQAAGSHALKGYHVSQQNHLAQIGQLPAQVWKSRAGRNATASNNGRKHPGV
jgi:hypothetical protein